MNNKIKLYLNTVKHLKISQIFYRPINRIKRRLYKKGIFKIQISSELNVKDDFKYLTPIIDFDPQYLERFDLENIFRDEFTFINIKSKIGLSHAWNCDKLHQLWRYNLHYFEFLYKLAFEYAHNNDVQYYEKYKYLIENWIDNNPFAYGDGWHPYTISLRLTNWITVYPIFRDRIKNELEFDKKVKESMYLQYLYLQKNLEKDVLGNHYFENIKALIIGSIFFKEDKIRNKFKFELLKELNNQILKDGMHFELSPMYHKIILEDLIKITYWLSYDKEYAQLIIYIQKMINVMFSFEDNFGKTPAFNDSTDGISKEYSVLLDACSEYFNLNPTFDGELLDSGYYIILDRTKKLIFDAGEICPRYLPAHGHCDALSYELSVNNKPLIVNSGTFTYENGEWRNYFRSTKAHNTVMIEEQEQSQFWGSFRVADRIKKVRKKIFIYKDIVFYVGAYNSYKGNEHKRFVGILDENQIIILDFIKNNLNAESYIHFLPKAQINIYGKKINVICNDEEIEITTIGTSNISLEQGWYSKQFNEKEENSKIILNKNKTKTYFGYLINLSSNNIETKVYEDDNELKIICYKEIIIKLNELGEML